jgi:hypothetical protein
VNGGTVARGGTFVGTYARFPQWNKRSKRVIALQDRLAECFLYSMNGTPRGATLSCSLYSGTTMLSVGMRVPLRREERGSLMFRLSRLALILGSLTVAACARHTSAGGPTSVPSTTPAPAHIASVAPRPAPHSPAASPAVSASAATPPASPAPAASTPALTQAPSPPPAVPTSQSPLPKTPSPPPRRTPSPLARVASTAADLPPKILSISLTDATVHSGETVHEEVIATSNTASVEARIGGYSSSLRKTGVGTFQLDYKVPWLPFFLHGRYDVLVIARNTEGVQYRRIVHVNVQ